MLNIFTIVLNGMPHIQYQHAIFKKLKCDWRWVIVHGYAKPVKDTAWCQDIEPPEDDGTLAYVQGLANSYAHVALVKGDAWQGKTEMCNAALKKLATFGGPGVLMQIDADEIWEPWQLDRIHDIQGSNEKNFDTMAFRCRYWVGPYRHVFGFDCFGNNTTYEWHRAWSWNGIDSFNTHEPPRLSNHGRALHQNITCNQLGLVFDHYAYATREQVAFKEKYYGYNGLMKNWEQLNNQSGIVLVPSGCFGNRESFVTVDTNGL